MNEDERVKVYQQIYDLTVSNNKKDKEIERLNNIINEVREKIENTQFAFDFEREINKLAFDLTFTKQGQELLEILDKEN